MGRNTTGSVCTKEVLRIELSKLLRQGYIKKGCRIKGVIEWTDGSNISIETNYMAAEKWIQLTYTITLASGESFGYQRQISFTTKKSNLGRGEVLYFICPETGRKCRILYKCYGSHIWKSRQAYKHRIYYNKQMLTKRSYYIESYFEAEERLQQMHRQRKSYTYKGKPTKRYIRLIKTEKALDKFDMLRWQLSPKMFQLMFQSE
ncbi:MAG: hypothetical protein A2W93_06260 [Bacteroidetes bacterium GWF2_43_63]|nr:MAG: hypothetical protein A2W94_08275 [Bacteroidetes bacterium GWE2_42_42]OFY53223.1 MAG: hypothetical protein A2W93_06260 [Bacteroidetes bacterium GWF2_43_63]HBG71785.1 hypothetical protein [Bacteroidales bacterium]HCB61550.1 hypothetical protein [Bacteroidales bacterium]HCY22762.1 hypothetical protein [Bacteroidales bacterium]